MTILVSVIIPVHSDPTGIEIALNALLVQTYPQDAFEIIVADNRSTDNTSQVVRKFQAEHPGRIRLVVENHIQSSYAARNKGIQAARGEILALTDADCKPAPTWLEMGVQTLMATNAAFVAGRIKLTFHAAVPNIYEYLNASRDLDQRAYVKNTGFGATANLFVWRNMFTKYGLFCDDLQSGGDYEFGRRLTKAGEKLVYTEEAIVYHPARSTLQAILKKIRRVARGEKQLAEMGLLEHAQISWRSFVPWQRYSPVEGVSLALWKRAAVRVAAIFCKYYKLVYRLF